jgi:hypothetical protein
MGQLFIQINHREVWKIFILSYMMRTTNERVKNWFPLGSCVVQQNQSTCFICVSPIPYRTWASYGIFVGTVSIGNVIRKVYHNSPRQIQIVNGGMNMNRRNCRGHHPWRQRPNDSIGIIMPKVPLHSMKRRFESERARSHRRRRPTGTISRECYASLYPMDTNTLTGGVDIGSHSAANDAHSNPPTLILPPVFR